MTAYHYKGRAASGQLVSGIQEAADMDAVATALQLSGLIPIEIKPLPPSNASAINITLFEKKVSRLDVMLFSRQMHTLLKAGIPIMRALAGIQASLSETPLGHVIAKLRASLDAGREFSIALSEHPAVFDAFYINMIRVGESTGNLDNIFLSLFHHISFERFMHGQIKTALRYPTFVVSAMLGALAVINLMVIPQFEKVFKSMHAELPWMTRALITCSEFTRDYLWVMVGLSVFAWWLFRLSVGRPSGRVRWDAFKMRIPIAGKIIFKGAMARFAQTLALSIRSGVPIVTALKLVAQTVGNAHLTHKMTEMVNSIERGDSISRAATQSGVFTPLVLQMIAVGEESGAMDELMQEIADMYQADVEYEVKTLGSQIEPVLILVLGVMILILALGVFLPIWDMSSVMFKGAT